VATAKPQKADRPSTALVLSGGGARGAYQVGVLRGLVDEGFLPRDQSGLDIIVGSSAGAINAASLAAFADDFEAGLGRIERVWANIEAQHVFRTDVTSLGKMGARWAWDLSFGGVTGQVRSESLLDTAPLRELLARRIPLARVDNNIKSGALQALALIATDLHTSNGVVFLHAAPGMPTWKRRRWQIEAVRTRFEHLLASSAIPVFFPSVEIDGCYYGDGSIRNTAPLSPAINLGAERIIAIGVSGPPPAKTYPVPRQRPTIAQVAGVLLDAVMLDAIEVDVEHSERVNTSVMRFPADLTREGFRAVDVLWLQPSRQVRAMAAELSDRIPRVVRYLMRGLGSDEAVTELSSYLLFDSEFCGRLMELGRSDVIAERERIEKFFAGGARG
jgi:NTE family protein